jgi:hypothetical protein
MPVGGMIVLLCNFSTCPAHVEQCDLLPYLICAIEGKGEWEALEAIYSPRQDCAVGVCSPESGPSAVNERPVVETEHTRGGIQ